MIASNIICRGVSRFLNTIYCQDISVSGSATLSSLSLSGNLSVTGTSTLTGHVSIGGYNNTSYGLSTNSAIVNDWIRTVGNTGWYNQTWGGGWYMTDGNYVRSYAKPVMMGHNLYFNSQSYYVNTSGAASFSSIAAPTATISNATITGDLTVGGVLQANDFIKNIVKAVGGQLYVSPTFQALSSTTVTCTAVTTTQLSLTLSDSAINGTDYAGATWYKDSKVMLSGTLTANTTGHTEEIIFSSVPGIVTANMSNSNKLQIKLDYNGASTYFKTGTLTTSDVAVMMYQICIPSGSTNAGLHPIGIYIKAYGTDNKNSYIDIFGGTSNTPNARLGLLTGLSAMQNGTTPSGWGIATTNGFFDGTIVSSSGKIGAFTLSSDLRSGTWGASGSVLVAGGYTPTTADAKSIGGSPTTGNTWAFTAGNTFGVTTAGKIYASDAKISGDITATSGTIGGVTANNSYGLYTNSKTSAKSTNTGFLISKDGAIYLGAYDSSKTSCPFQVTSAGALTARSATITGTINADTGSFGGSSGFTIASGAMYSNSKSSTTSTNDGVYIGTSGIYLGAYNSEAESCPFQVTDAGALTATSATISGTLTAGNGSKIGDWDITSARIQKNAAGYITGMQAASADTSAAFFAGWNGGGNITQNSAFWVRQNGSFYAQSGKIGNWSFSDQMGLKLTENGYQYFYDSNGIHCSSGTDYVDQIFDLVIDSNKSASLELTDNATVMVQLNVGGGGNAVFGGTVTFGYNGKLVSNSNGNTGFQKNDNWTIYEDSAGIVHIPHPLATENLDGTSRRPVGTANNNNNGISHVSSSTTGININAFWGAASRTSRSLTVPSSDIRLKENIKSTTLSGLDLINKIDMYEFDWKDDKRHQKLGFVADYLEKLDPNLSIGGGEDEEGKPDYKSVNTFYLQGYEVRAIQELSSENSALKKKITELEERISRLEKR